MSFKKFLAESLASELKDAGFNGKPYQIIRHPHHGPLRVIGTAPGAARLVTGPDGKKKKVNDVVLQADDQNSIHTYHIDVATANANLTNKVDWS